MGRKSTKTAAETVIDYKKELADARAEIEILKKQVAKKKTKKRKRIPRPKGQAGRASGFNLQSAMGLAEEGEHYNRLVRVVKDITHQRLVVEKTISDQDKVKLDGTIVHIGKIVPFFDRFEGLWPIKEIISTYLRNMQTRRRKDLDDEGIWFAGHKDDEWLAGNVDAEEVEAEAEDMDLDEDDAQPVHAAFRKAPEPNTVPAAKKSSGTKKKPNTKSKTSAIAEPVAQKSQSKKRSSTDAGLEESVSKKPSPVQPKPKRPKKFKSLTWDQLPANCPDPDCPDLMPDICNEKILTLYNKRRSLIFAGGDTGRGVGLATLELCLAISQENQKPELLKLAMEQGWPVTIDWESVPRRVLDLSGQLLQMIQDIDTLENSPIWLAFINNIGGQIFAFSDSSKQIHYPSALAGRRCGYYGAKGEFLIQSTVMRILAGNEEDLSNMLCDTVDEIVKNDLTSFDDYDPTSNLISLKDFVSFLLVPFAATLLIAEDQGASMEDAMEIRESSARFGLAMHPEEDDDVIEELHLANIRATKQPDNPYFALPPRFRKAEVIESGPNTDTTKKKPQQAPVAPAPLTLDDFVEPQIKKKNKLSSPKKKAARTKTEKPVDDVGPRRQTRSSTAKAKK
ncbi:hypothetical protein FB45DRAFT_1107473 [Roridomyces roridus]|uniref:Restriction of telomere capping protein 4 n=1 Tax=Roridomyces roridus TaxID=1738132 RepID=A0AAD7AWV8_9AGAR|nr:hypothetical protein FB45DRAFT_1107473 [Roridomyces roridus]